MLYKESKVTPVVTWRVLGDSWTW